MFAKMLKRFFVLLILENASIIGVDSLFKVHGGVENIIQISLLLCVCMCVCVCVCVCVFLFFFKYPLDVSAGRPDLPVFQVINRPQFE